MTQSNNQLSEIVDGQLHELGPRSGVAVDDLGTRRRIMLEVTASAMDAVGIDAALLVPVDTGVADLAFSEFPNRFASILIPDPEAEDISDQVAAVPEQPGVLGVRVVAGFPSTGEEVARLKAGIYDPMFDAADRHGVPVFFFISGDLPLTVPILEKHPDLTLIIDHLGIRQAPMDERDTPPFKTLPDLLSLAKYPNVAVKVCGVPALSEAGYPYDDVWPFVHQIYEAFGPERLIWASDTPRFQGRIGWEQPTPLFARGQGPYIGKHSYAESLELFKNTSELTSQEKQLLLGGNLRRILRWPASAPV